MNKNLGDAKLTSVFKNSVFSPIVLEESETTKITYACGVIVYETKTERGGIKKVYSLRNTGKGLSIELTGTIRLGPEE